MHLKNLSQLPFSYYLPIHFLLISHFLPFTYLYLFISIYSGPVSVYTRPPLTTKACTRCHANAAEVVVWLHGDDSGALCAMCVGVYFVVARGRVPIAVYDVIAQTWVLVAACER